MPAIAPTEITLPVPKGAEGVFTQDFEGGFDVEGEVVLVENGQMTLRITAIYPQGEAQTPDFGALAADFEGLE